MLDAIVLDLNNTTAVHANVKADADVDVVGLIAVDLDANVDADVKLDVLDTNVKV